jgi:hypothetical protein
VSHQRQAIKYFLDVFIAHKLVEQIPKCEDEKRRKKKRQTDVPMSFYSEEPFGGSETFVKTPKHCGDHLAQVFSSLSLPSPCSFGFFLILSPQSRQPPV